MLKNKYGFQVNISLSIFFIAFCDLFTDFPTYDFIYFNLYIPRQQAGSEMNLSKQTPNLVCS
jgi:hypothetical protein